MYQITFTLKQHTPIIHFQHEQEGATLRATEVKPKLDRFILQSVGNGNYKTGYSFAKKNNWLSGNGEHPSLNYKLRFKPVSNEVIQVIEKDAPSFGSFFGNMGPEYINHIKALVFTEQPITGQIICLNLSLVNKLLGTNILESFFALNNFGTRQSKGFGSFSVTVINNEEKIFPSKQFPFYFDLSVKNNSSIDDFRTLFKRLNWFYKSLRSGLNEIRGGDNYPKLYFKSLLFQYVHEYLKQQWDKKTIKKHFLDVNQAAECEWYGDDIVCNASSQNQTLDNKNFKDLFGLSSLEKWGNQFTLKKTQATFENGKWQKTKENNTTVHRFKSPMFFKILKNKDSFRVFFNFQKEENGYDDFINSTFLIERTDGRSQPFALPFFKNFDYIHFINWVLDNVNIKKRFIVEGNNYEFKEIEDTLVHIFKNISRNRQA